MTELQNKLVDICDKKYADFQSNIVPNVEKQRFIGVRVPVLRKFAKNYIKQPECWQFLEQLPHYYYDENMLHGLLIQEIKDYDKCVNAIEKFLPYVDNWAVCDIMSPKALRQNKTDMIQRIKKYANSSHTYIARFWLEMLMRDFLDEDFNASYLEIVASVHSQDYYLRMMVAWFFATALAKQWKDTIPYIEQHRLDDWVHNKTIQKAIESYRITDEQKQYLRSWKDK